MKFMNEYDIADAYERFGNRQTPLGEAARLLKAFQEDVNRHSDGWPYWSLPVKAAKHLIELVDGQRHAGMGTWPSPPEPTEDDLRKALAPIKRFMTMKGKAAGMTWSAGNA